MTKFTDEQLQAFSKQVAEWLLNGKMYFRQDTEEDGLCGSRNEYPTFAVIEFAGGGERVDNYNHPNLKWTELAEMALNQGLLK